MMPSEVDLVVVLRDAHIFDAIPQPRGRKPLLRGEVWRAYCSCGWWSRVVAASVEAAEVDHRLHRRRVGRPFRRWAQ